MQTGKAMIGIRARVGQSEGCISIVHCNFSPSKWRKGKNWIGDIKSLQGIGHLADSGNKERNSLGRLLG